MSSVISRPEWPPESWTGCCAVPLSTKLGLDLLDQLLVQLGIATQEASDQAKVLLAVRKAGRARLGLLQPIRQIGKVIAQPLDAVKRRGWDSNPRGTRRPLTVFETAPFNHSGTPPGRRLG